MPNSPTIVSAALSDKELQDSINKMVANFDKGLQTMLEHSNEYVGKIQASLQKIGDTNFGAKGSNDGGVAKQTKAQNEFTDAVKKSTNEIKRQGKEGEMSFDQIAAALDKARRTVSEFNTKRASGILPSSEDYKRYEQALARIVEYNDKLKQSALSRADANQWANVFDGKRVVSDLTTIDDRLKQLNNEYKKLEAESKKAFGQDLKDAFKLPTTSLDEVTKKILRLKELSFRGQDQGFISQTQISNVDNVVRKLRELQQEMKANVIPQNVANYIKSVGTVEDQLKLAFARANKIPTDQLDLAQAKLERLQALLRDMRERGILSNTQIASTEAEIRKLEQIIGQVNTAQQQTTQAAQRYTEETEKGNRALQEQKEHLERIKDIASQARKDIGQYGFANITNYRGVVYAENDERAKGLTIEQQIEKIIQEENAARNAQLGTEKQITQEIEQRGKKYVSPNTEINTAFNRMVANKIGLSEQDINTTSTKISALTQYIKQLEQAWSKMTDAEKNSPFGRQLRQELQYTTRLVQQARTELTRPINLKDALSGSEKTLDDIAYKMQRLRAYKQGIDLTKPNATNEIKQVDEALAKLQKDADKWMGKSQQMIKINTALGRSWNYMKNRLAFYFTVGASTQFVKNLIEVRSQYEMNERALGILIDSAERGTQIFNELSQMALVSPYTLIELSTAAKQLTAYDIAAKDVVDTTRRLADMAAAVGIPIERLTYALGQIKAYGYLNSRDARMFANAGIPLVKQLSEYYTELEGRLVSTADVYDRIKKKSIDYNEVMEVINKMTDQGGKFFDFQAKMADTLKVRLANLTLAWNNMLNDIGKESQGILTWGIGALRELFLHWKQFDSLIKNVAWALGIRTAFMFIAWSAQKAGVALGVTSKQMALSSVFGTRLAGVLKTVAVSLRAIVTSPLTWWSLLAIAAVEATQAIFGANEAQKALNESIRNGAKDNYDNISKFLEQYKDVRDSLYSTQKVAIGSIYNPTTRKAEATAYAEQQVEQDIDKNEAKKAWEAIREQIELTSQSSDVFISKLLSIENMSERVRQGFNILDDIQVVNAALKELDDNAIKVTQDYSAWWNIWQAPDGLIENLEDFTKTINTVYEQFGNIDELRELASKDISKATVKETEDIQYAKNAIEVYERNLERFRDDLQKTTDSIINFIELKGWSGDEGKINQVFEQITQKLILDNQLDPQKAFTLQIEVEEARSKAAKEALLQRINDEKAAYKISHDESVREALNADIERYNNWNETNGRSKVEWERFTKWLKEQHISETTQMFRNMDAEDIKSLNFQEGKHAEWVDRMVTKYAKEHKMSYDEAFNYLKSRVRNANTWSIFIPLIISTEDKKSVYDQLGEYDKAIDDADAQIERLTRRIGELNAKRKKSKDETKELTRAEQELSDAQKAKADAEAKGGHGKKEKKDEKAARKAARQAESELQKALKDELSTIEKVRSIYKDLTKEGMSHANAVERATKGWDETVNAINKVLQKNGLQKLDLSKFAGIENPRELVDMLQSQLDILVKRGAKPAEIKELQTKIRTLKVDSDKYDLTKITQGLNSELGKLKEEYELAVELDANPELGGMFADFMGINMDELPKTFQEATKKAQEYIDKVFQDNGRTDRIDIASMLDKESFDNWVKDSGLKMDSELVKSVEAFRQYLHKTQVDEAKKQIDEWGKLLEKYAEYEYKRKQILDTYEREMDVARKQNADKAIRDAIERRKNEQLAELDFNEFMKTPEWIVATGDLAGMSKQAIDMLIEEIEKYKKAARNLSPKQIHNLNKALKNLYKEQRKNNPFRAISNMLEEARGRAETFDEEIEKVQKEIQDLTFQKSAELAAGIVNEDTNKRLTDAIERLKELKKNKENLGKIDASDWVQSINDTITAVRAAVSVFDDLAKAIGGVKGNSDIDKIFSVLEKGGQGAAIGAQFGGYGAIIGAVAGVATGIISTFADQWSGNASITKAIQDSEHEVRKLELAYIDLEHAVNEAYGDAEIGAKQAVIANKKLQLAELQRQLALEKSRSSKNRDEERIIEIQKQIKELEYEISDATKDIVNDLLGISSVGDFAENLVSQMIEAFKNGEDYMEKFEESFDDMIDNMIMKAIVSRVIDDRIEQIFNYLDSQIKSDSQGLYDEKSALEQERERLKEGFESLEKNPVTKEMFGEITRMYKDKLRDLDNRIEEINRQINEAGSQSITPEMTEDVRDMVSGMKDNVREEFLALMDAFGITYGQSSSGKDLSQLQQGIQSITEVTASALEAYMNGVSQQVYYHSTLLEQIRDAVVGTDSDIQLGVQGQMLLQLQQSYQVQMSIQGILEGVLVPSGRAFAVELMS